jgi:hypothetical protein
MRAHPHVHVVLKALDEDGHRLNIRKATLRSWRAKFAENLRGLGVPANATERAVRGESRTHKRDGIYRAAQRGELTHLRARDQPALHMKDVTTATGLGAARLQRTRQHVVEGWRQTAMNLRAMGDHELADRVRGKRPVCTALTIFVAKACRARICEIQNLAFSGTGLDPRCDRFPLPPAEETTIPY